MPSSAAQLWNLESFLDSLILELDKAQDTLAVKGVTRRLTYMVKDVALDLHIFPRYDDGKLRFAAAGPGESGASRLSIQLGSITDRQIREAANEPISRDDVAIDLIEEVDPELRDSLRKVGVTSARDLERLETRNVDLEKVVTEKVGKEKTSGYEKLAKLINRARRRRLSPIVARVSTLGTADAPGLRLEGERLVLDSEALGYPLALLNDEPVEVRAAGARSIELGLPAQALRQGANQLKIALDPYAVMTLEIRA